jgi:cell division GTPase FtsZ
MPPHLGAHFTYRHHTVSLLTLVCSVRAEVDPDANIIFGSTIDDSMTGRLRVSVVATGLP